MPVLVWWILGGVVTYALYDAGAFVSLGLNAHGSPSTGLPAGAPRPQPPILPATNGTVVSGGLQYLAPEWLDFVRGKLAGSGVGPPGIPDHRWPSLVPIPVVPMAGPQVTALDVCRNATSNNLDVLIAPHNDCIAIVAAVDVAMVAPGSPWAILFIAGQDPVTGATSGSIDGIDPSTGHPFLMGA